jgi:hypothetical protein
VVSAGATKLAFSGQPSNTATAGQSFAVSPTVVAQDASNNTATTYTSLVTLSAYTDVGCLTAAAGVVSNGIVSAASGVVAYSNVSYNKSGTIYLKALGAGVTLGCSNAISVVPDAVTQLAFSTPASTTNTAGTNFSTQPVVVAYDANSNLNTTYTTAMTISAFTDASCTTAALGTLNGNTHATTAGSSAFAGMNYTLSGTIYLKAFSGSVASPCSGAINVGAGAVSTLAFTTNPSTTNTAGVALATQPVLEARDASNNLVPTFASSVTLMAYTDVGCLTAAGTFTNRVVSGSSGVVTYSTLTYSGVGTVYTKALTASSVTSACSSALTFVPGPVTQLVFTTAPSATNTAGSALSTQLFCTDHSASGPRKGVKNNVSWFSATHNKLMV